MVSNLICIMIKNLNMMMKMRKKTNHRIKIFRSNNKSLKTILKISLIVQHSIKVKFCSKSMKKWLNHKIKLDKLIKNRIHKNLSLRMFPNRKMLASNVIPMMKNITMKRMNMTRKNRQPSQLSSKNKLLLDIKNKKTIEILHINKMVRKINEYTDLFRYLFSLRFSN